MFEPLVKKIVRAEKASGKIDVSLVNDQLIRKLNRDFRKKDKPTDVLAFPYGEEELAQGVIGDVIISRDTTRRNARSYGVSYSKR